MYKQQITIVYTTIESHKMLPVKIPSKIRTGFFTTTMATPALFTDLWATR